MTEKAIKDKTNQKVHLISSRPAGLPPHSEAPPRAGEINRAVEAREIVAAEGPSSGEWRWPTLKERESGGWEERSEEASAAVLPPLSLPLSPSLCGLLTSAFIVR